MNKLMNRRKRSKFGILVIILALLGMLGIHNQVSRSDPYSGMFFESRLFFKSRQIQNAVSTTTTTAAPTKKPVTSVLILTYMRSGSSLTGDILQQSTDAFYLFEPLRTLHQRNRSLPIDYVNGTIRKPPFQFVEEAANELHHWFTCDITKLARVSVMDGFLNFGLRPKQFKACMNNRTASKLYNHTELIYRCSLQLKAICEDSPLRIVKTIRLEMRSISQLLGLIPHLKILHLIRDPRATMLSQSHTGMCPEKDGGKYGCTSRFCLRLENDVLEEEKLSARHPGRVSPVFYEQLASHPFEAVKKMYSFVGVEYTKYAMEYTFNQTMAGKKDDCVICTTRANSSAHINAWKREMKQDFIDTVQERCNYVLRRHGYSFYPPDRDINIIL